MERRADSGAGGRRLLPKRHFMVKMLCEAVGVEPERSECDGLERDEKQPPFLKTLSIMAIRFPAVYDYVLNSRLSTILIFRRQHRTK